MKETKELKTNKGITLIALVITIIVMLILVSVTISMAVNGGLFEKAEEAVQKTNTAMQQEQALAEGRIKVGEWWYDSIDYYLKGLPSENQGDGNTFTYVEFSVFPEDREQIGYTGEEGENLVIPKYFKGIDGTHYKVTEIGDDAFYDCYNLREVSIPDGVTYIGAAAFKECNSLTKVYIPNSVEEIDHEAFNICDNLTDVYFSGTQEEWESIIIVDTNTSLLSDTITIHFGA